MDWKVEIHLGIVFAYRLFGNGWFRDIRAFPNAIDKNGNPVLNHPLVTSFIKERT